MPQNSVDSEFARLSMRQESQKQERKPVVRFEDFLITEGYRFIPHNPNSRETRGVNSRSGWVRNDKFARQSTLWALWQDWQVQLNGNIPV